MHTTEVNLRLPDSLVEKADVAAEATDRNRTEVVKRALHQYFREVADDEAFREAVVESYLDDQISFDVLTEFVGRQDAEAIRASRDILDRGNEISEELEES
jgi:predicted transcriptional regulator